MYKQANRVVFRLNDAHTHIIYVMHICVYKWVYYEASDAFILRFCCL